LRILTDLRKIQSKNESIFSVFRGKKVAMRKSIKYPLIGTAASIVVLLAIYFFLHSRTLQSDTILADYIEDANCSSITIHYPLDETLFPPEIISPKFEWKDDNKNSDFWLISINFQATFH
jgi:hypothetical protein